MTAPRMTTQEILDLMATDAPLNRARREFYNQCMILERASHRRVSPIEIRRLEFEAVRAIAEALGVLI